jgi:hypothetical protein
MFDIDIQCCFFSFYSTVPQNNLAGTIPSELGLMTALQAL